MRRFEILDGLPPYGPQAESFSAKDTGKHCEGFVVRFMPAEAGAWVGNCVRGMTRFDAVRELPDGSGPIIVIAGGEAYLVDPLAAKAHAMTGGMIVGAYPIPELNQVLLDNTCWFEIVGASGLQWKTPRLSWDGFRSISIQGAKVFGEAYSPVDKNKEWFPFAIDLVKRSAEGGSYAGPR